MAIPFEVDGATRHVAVWLPDNYDPGRVWPAILFLHAYEERGDHLEHLSVGIGPALERHPHLYQAIVLLPQCPEDRVWSVVDRSWADGMQDAEAHLDAALDAALDRLPIDPGRVALTGASMGGYATFAYGARHSSRH